MASKPAKKSAPKAKKAAKAPKAPKAAKPAKPAPADEGLDANEVYNEGLRLAKTVEKQLRGGRLSAADVAIVNQAVERFQKAIELADNHGRAHIMLGNMFRYTGRGTEAIPHFERAMGLPEDSDDWVKACDGLASCLMEPATLDRAIEVLRLGVKHHGRDPVLLYKLGACLVEKGENADAATVLETCVEVDPSHSPARQLLDRAKAMVAAAAQGPGPSYEVPAEYAEKQKKVEKLATELQAAIQKLMLGKESPEQKTAKAMKLQQDFQAAVTKLYGG